MTPIPENPKFYLGSLIGRTGRLLGNAINAVFQANGYSSTREQWITLCILRSKDGISQQDLANIGFKNKASITSIVDQLEKGNLVQRVQDKMDRRNNLLFLTSEGLNMQDRLSVLAESAIDNLLKNIEYADIEVCKSVLQKMITNMTAEN